MKICNSWDSTKTYHIFCIVTFLIFFIYERTVSQFSFLTSLLYLTIISFHMNFIYYTLSFLYEIKILKILNKESLDKFFNLCVIFSFTAGVMFWVLSLQDPNSVVEKGVEIPIILNLFLHGGTFIIALLEQVIFNKRTTQNHFNLIYLAIIVALYSLLLKGIYVIYDFDVYPFVKENWIEFSITCFSAFCISVLGHYIYKVLSFTRFQELKSEDKNETKVANLENSA
jgi:hypothetical protein